MTHQEPLEMKLAELAERSKTPARTIRLYITMQLLPGPLRPGRNAAYGPGHLERLEQIRALQREGMTLSQVRRRLMENDNEPTQLFSTSWKHYAVAPDVQVMIQEDVPPWRAHVLRQAVEQFIRTVNTMENSQEPKNEQ